MYTGPMNSCGLILTRGKELIRHKIIITTCIAAVFQDHDLDTEYIANASIL